MLPRASNSGKIALVGSCRLRSTLAQRESFEHRNTLCFLKFSRISIPNALLSSQADYYESLATGLLLGMDGVVLTCEIPLTKDRGDDDVPVWKAADIAYNHAAWWLAAPSSDAFWAISVVCRVCDVM